MSKEPKFIRFIDSNYKDLFTIPDGGSIKVTFLPNDTRDSAVFKCKYIDSHHFEIHGNGVDSYHICQFAELMESIGAKYEPLVQLQEVVLVPFKAGDEKFYTYNREEGNTCAGHVSGNFGDSGERFHSGWNNHITKAEEDWSDISPKLQTELHSAVYALRRDLLRDRDSMLSFCKANPEALIESGDTFKRYGFKLETDMHQYYTQCFIGENPRDTRFVIYAYENPAQSLENEKPICGAIISATADESKMFYRNEEERDSNVGYLRGDFGKNGSEFWHNWFDENNGKNTSEFEAELQEAMTILRKDVLKDFKSSSEYCRNHYEAKLPGNGEHYGFKLETENHRFFVRCSTLKNDYFYVFAYQKADLREQEKQSVVKQIKTAQKCTKETDSRRKSKKTHEQEI